MENNDIMVSIICNAYNHERYIEDALLGFVMQDTSFSYEVLVHDDASTDGTAEIIKKFARTYPKLFKPIFQSENQWSKQDGTIRELQLSRARGRYIALCEGDDFWTDVNKLQIQFEYLESHNDINMVTHRTKNIDAENKQRVGERRPCKKNCILSPERIIESGGGVIATNSLFYRREIVEYPMRFFKNMPYDFSLQILGSLPNGIYYFDECMSSYRKFSENSWTSRLAKDNERYFAFKKKIINMLTELDEDTNYKYHPSVEKSIYREEYDILARTGDSKKMIGHPYFDMIGFRYRIKPFIRRYLKLNV